MAFEVADPNIDERPLPEEPPKQLVARLAQSKAEAIATKISEGLIIGSDQVAVLEDQVLTKPGDHQTAVQQLQQASGKTVTFLTGLCVLNSQTHNKQVIVEPFQVTFRSLGLAQIENYLRKEKPYDCAGSFKSEGLGIALFERLQGDDPNALMGLPLIRLIGMLEKEGLTII